MSRFLRLPAGSLVAAAILLAACSSGGSSSSSRSPDAAPAGPTAGRGVDTGPRVGDDRTVRASELTALDLQEFRIAWAQFLQDLPVWSLSRERWLARGGAAPYVLSENLFRHFWRASLVTNEREIARVGENAAVVGEPAVAYFAKALVTDRWPLAKPITTEVMDPDNLDKRLKRTFHFFEMDDQTRRYAARVLVRIGPPAVPTLRSDAVLRRSRPTSRRYAAYALGTIATPEAVEALVVVLQRADDWQDRSAAASALGAALPTNPQARAPLERAARSDPDEFVRRKASESLAGPVRLRF